MGLEAKIHIEILKSEQSYYSKIENISKEISSHTSNIHNLYKLIDTFEYSKKQIHFCRIRVSDVQGIDSTTMFSFPTEEVAELFIKDARKKIEKINTRIEELKIQLQAHLDSRPPVG